MSLIKPVNFTCLGDERGSLVALESDKDVPFDIKRVYYIFGTKGGVSRGFHAHRNLKQVAVCVAGSCQFVLDNGNLKESIVLNNPFNGIFIDGLIWREIHHITSNCVLMVLASEYYSEDDYIRDYSDFKKEVFKCQKY